LRSEGVIGLINSEIVENKFKNKGYKFTFQRRAVLNVMLENRKKHLATEDVYKLVKKKCPEVGLATVYRALQLLEHLGIVDRLSFDDGYSRYELSESKKLHHHHHLICVKCGSVQEVEDDLLEDLEREIEEKKHFVILNHRVKFFGYCQKCAGK